jgi:hypothetical protein
MRIYKRQYPSGLPHNALGAKYAKYVCRTMAFDPVDRREQWLDCCARWLDADERRKILSLGPYWYGERSLGEHLELYDEDREHLKAWTVEAFDVTPEQRKAINREKNRKRLERRRRESGVKPREQWLADNHVSRTKAWLAVGMSRAQWYRKGKPSVETGPNAPLLSYKIAVTPVSEAPQSQPEVRDSTREAQPSRSAATPGDANVISLGANMDRQAVSPQDDLVWKEAA